jgi:hypothetical protein
MMKFGELFRIMAFCVLTEACRDKKRDRGKDLDHVAPEGSHGIFLWNFSDIFHSYFMPMSVI